MAKPTKKTTKKPKGKAKAKVKTPAAVPTSPEDALAQIAARAEGGKVAVLERGQKKPKIVQPGGEKEAPKPIGLTDDAKETINDVLRRSNNLDSQIAQNRARFMAAEKELLEQRENAQKEVETTIKMLGRRFKVPDGWVLNLEDMTFVPRPRQPGLGGPFPRQ